MDDDARLNSVAEALAHVEAPRAAIEWAERFGHDVPLAWRACPHPSWRVHLAHTARMPFASILAAVVAASRYFLDVFPRDDVSDLLEVGIPLEDVAGHGVADVSHIEELVSNPAFAEEERGNMGYGDGFVEQAYYAAATTLEELEEALITFCDHTPERARERLLSIVREHTSDDEFLHAYVRAVRLGYAGLELNR